MNVYQFYFPGGMYVILQAETLVDAAQKIKTRYNVPQARCERINDQLVQPEYLGISDKNGTMFAHDYCPSIPEHLRRSRKKVLTVEDLLG